MSRHRIVRSQAFQNDYSDDDYSDDDHEIDSGLSDRQASQYMFDRSKPSTSIWGDQSTAPSHRTLPESDDELQPELSDEQRAVALSCIDQIRDIVGDKLREAQLLRIVVQNDFDVSRSIDAALNAEPDASAAHRTASSSQRKTQPKSKAPADKDASPRSLGDLIKQRTAGGESASNSAPFTKLSDLTSFHLNKPSAFGGIALNIPKLNVSNGPFRIPKLNNGLNDPERAPNAVPTPPTLIAGGEQTPHAMSLRKILDLRNIQLTEANRTAEQRMLDRPVAPAAPIVVNLLAAAAADVIPRHVSIARSFADADPTDPDAPPKTGHRSSHVISDNPLVVLSDNLTKDCQLDVSRLAWRKVAQKTARRSRIGRVLCSRYTNELAVIRARMRVRHAFAVPAHAIEAYAFDRPSPDDLILRQLAKWKK